VKWRRYTKHGKDVVEKRAHAHASCCCGLLLDEGLHLLVESRRREALADGGERVRHGVHVHLVQLGEELAAARASQR